MADRFEDLGIAPELVAGVEALGWDAPAGLQRDAVPVLRRGNNLVLHASAGSGVVGAYGLGVLDRLLTDGGGLRALVLVPDAVAASATADSLARLAAATTLTVGATAPGWSRRDTDVLVASAAAAAAAVRDSSLKLGDLIALIVDGADRIADSDQWTDLETLVDAVPTDAQRVVATGRLDSRIDDFAERHVRRAMTVPPRSGDEAAPAAGATVRYAVASRSDRTAAAVHLLDGLDAPEIAVVCRTLDDAERVGGELAARGVAVRGEQGTGAEASGARVLVLPRLEADQRTTRALVLSFDPPFDAAELAELHGGGGAVLVTPRERAHLVRIAGRAGIRLEAVPLPEPGAMTPAEALRAALRAALADGELAPELALLEPLLAEHPAAEVAAAAIRHARRSSPGATRAEPGRPDRPAGGRSGTAAPPPPGGPTWVHLFMTVGSRDDVGPGDVVGAVTGEAGVSGDQVGKVDIHQSHTIVEVATEVAGKVIEALNGRTLKGRSLRVDYDRKGTGRKPGGRAPRGGKRPQGGRGAGRGPGGRRG